MIVCIKIRINSFIVIVGIAWCCFNVQMSNCNLHFKVTKVCVEFQEVPEKYYVVSSLKYTEYFNTFPFNIKCSCTSNLHKPQELPGSLSQLLFKIPLFWVVFYLIFISFRLWYIKSKWDLEEPYYSRVFCLVALSCLSYHNNWT